MTPEKQRIAIATACKLDRLEPFRRATRKGAFRNDGVRILYCESHHGGEGVWNDIPNYPGCLNAMHEAEKTMNKDQTYTFNALLVDLKKGPKDADSYAERWTWHATAAQRARAFLETLGLWENDSD